MKIQIRGANRFEVTDAIKNYIEDKVGSLQRFLPTNQNLEARVYIKIYDVIQKVEVTIPGNHFILRAEEESDDLYAAIDLVVDKLERQIRKQKTKKTAPKAIKNKGKVQNSKTNRKTTENQKKSKKTNKFSKQSSACSLVTFLLEAWAA